MILSSLVAAIRFLTRVPIPGKETKPEDISRAIAWFPLVGAIVGLLTALVYIITSCWWPSQISAILSILFGLMLTGGFHEDGATDAADGLGGGWTSTQVIKIMRDSRIGAYGAMTLWVLLTFRWVTITTVNKKDIFTALPLSMAWGRWAIVAMLHWLPAISPGLASTVRNNGTNGTSFFLSSILIGLIMLAVYFLGYHDLWKPTAAAISSTAIWVAYLKKRIGGQTGDLLGAGNQIVEAAVLLSLVAT